MNYINMSFAPAIKRTTASRRYRVIFTNHRLPGLEPIIPPSAAAIAKR
jgi:hypothetical protein